MQATIDLCRSGAERDMLQGQLDRVTERVRELPRRVAAAGPFKNRDEAHAALTREIALVIAAIDGTN
jgi:hypothetical protein